VVGTFEDEAFEDGAFEGSKPQRSSAPTPKNLKNPADRLGRCEWGSCEWGSCDRRDSFD